MANIIFLQKCYGYPVLEPSRASKSCLGPTVRVKRKLSTAKKNSKPHVRVAITCFVGACCTVSEQTTKTHVRIESIGREHGRPCSV